MSATSANKAMIGTYELARRLGVGGMGEVWLARQRGAAGFARDVAIKRLLPQAMEQPDVVAMFIEEAQITGRLRHPNVVNVVELGAAESGELYLVLEYVDGTGLHKLLRDATSRPQVAGALAIGRDVALALHAAHTLTDDEGHELGLVHRDVTPSNVMLDKYGHIKLMDFGIAKVRAKSNQTEAGIIKGKIAYLAPEQLRGAVDPRSDLFSLGLVLWEMIAGRQARSGSSYAVMMAKVALYAVPSLGSVMPALPPQVIAAVDRACALDPEARYQSGEEMAQAMLAALESLPDRATMESARAGLAVAVKVAMQRDGEGAASGTRSSRTVDPERPMALTLHSLVVQDGAHTISRPLPPDVIKPAMPRDARATTGHSGPRRRRSNAFSVVALVGTAAVVSGVVTVRLVKGGRGPAVATTAALPLATQSPTASARPVETAPPSAVGPLPSTEARDPVVAAIAPPVTPLVAPPVTPLVAPPVTPPVVAEPSGRPAIVASAHPSETSAHGSVPRPTGLARRVQAPSTSAGPRAENSASDPAAPPASVGVNAHPWANIRIDNSEYGVTPRNIPLRAGAHTIVLSNPERQTSRTLRIQLTPGQRMIINENL